MDRFQVAYDVERADCDALARLYLRRRPVIRVTRWVLADVLVLSGVFMLATALHGTDVNVIRVLLGAVWLILAALIVRTPYRTAFRPWRNAPDRRFIAEVDMDGVRLGSRGATTWLPWTSVEHLGFSRGYLEVAGGGVIAVIATRALPAGLSAHQALSALRAWAATAGGPG